MNQSRGSLERTFPVPFLARILQSVQQAGLDLKDVPSNMENSRFVYIYILTHTYMGWIDI